MPKHKHGVFLTDEEWFTLVVTPAGLSWDVAKRLGDSATLKLALLRGQAKQTLENPTSHPPLKPTKPVHSPTERSGPWLAAKDQRTPNVPQG